MVFTVSMTNEIMIGFGKIDEDYRSYRLLINKSEMKNVCTIVLLDEDNRILDAKSECNNLTGYEFTLRIDDATIMICVDDETDTVSIMI